MGSPVGVGDDVGGRAGMTGSEPGSPVGAGDDAGGGAGMTGAEPGNDSEGAGDDGDGRSETIPYLQRLRPCKMLS